MPFFIPNPLHSGGDIEPGLMTSGGFMWEVSGWVGGCVGGWAGAFCVSVCACECVCMCVPGLFMRFVTGGVGVRVSVYKII